MEGDILNKSVLVSTLIKMVGVGDKRKEAWFFENGLTKQDLDEAVEMGLLERYDKDPYDFMSNAGYILTQKGRDFVWKRN